MNNPIDLYRRQDIHNYLEKMLGDGDTKLQAKGMSRSQRVKFRTVNTVRNEKSFIFEDMLDE